VKILIILNDPPYGTERSYNGLRLANNLLKADDTLNLTVFLMADAVACAKRGQRTPDGHYNVERMLKQTVHRGSVVLCGACMDARGLSQEELLDGSVRGTMTELAELTLASDQVLVF
jgi:uncharacterized protein involved in oxidation of intracellular sulfur|tara:strand:- start:180 stop:530 length:351 start_codon:yes stop_codon:yes gene_type:complete